MKQKSILLVEDNPTDEKLTKLALRESGVDVELANWRAVVAPAGISAADEAALEELILEMTRTGAWRDALDRRGWSDAALAGAEFDAFIESEQRRIAQIIDDMGLG